MIIEAKKVKDRKEIKLPECFDYTVCPGSSDPFFLVSYYIKWVTTSWTYGRLDRIH